MPERNISATGRSNSTISEMAAVLSQAVFRAITKEKETMSAVSVTQPESTLAEIFEYLNEAPRPVIVAIDEFQEISKYGEGKGLEKGGFITRSGNSYSLYDIFFATWLRNSQA